MIVHQRYLKQKMALNRAVFSSPVLFTIYMDQLLNRLEKSGLGCRIGAYYYGAYGYADDLMLLRIPTVNGLQKMVNICEQYGDEYGVKYNPIKTVAMHLSQKKPADPPHIDVADTKIKWVRVAKHL